MKVTTDNVLGKLDGATGVNGVLRPAGAGPSPLTANALALGGLVAVTSFVTALGLLRLRGPGDAWVVPFWLFAALALAGAAIAAAGVWHAARSTSGGARELLRLQSRAWVESANGWTMFLVGCALMLPAFALYTPTLTGDADSARIVSAILHVQETGLGYLVDTQEVLLPHLVLGPVLALGGIAGIQVVNALSVVLLGGVVGFIAWRLTRSPLGVVASVLALGSLPAILERAHLVPMYPTMLAFGFLGVYLAHLAIVEEGRSRRWQLAALAGLCLVLAFEAHQVGQLFLVVTVLLVVTGPPRSTLPGLGRVYLAVAALALPRLVINLMEGGFDHFFKNRVDFWVTQRYLEPIQAEFFGLPIRDSLGTYLGNAPDGFLDAWGPSGLPMLALALVGLVVMSSRLRRFALAVVLLVVAVAVYRRLPLYPRYLSLLFVGSAFAAGVALAWRPRIRPEIRVALASVALVALLAGVAASYREAAQDLQRLERTIAAGPYERLADALPPNAGVIGTRSVYLDFIATDVRVYGGQFLSEEDYVTFLTWPSDEAVVDVMRRHDIEWVFVPEAPWKWVRNYNDTWLLPTYGKSARYHEEVERSPLFCRAVRLQGATLYRLDPEGADTAVPGGEPRRCEPGSSSARR